MAKKNALFRFDVGLLFIAAGLAICAAAVLLPAQRDLVEMRVQLLELQQQDELIRMQLRVTADVIRELDRNDPGLQRRLISSQLNLAPATDTPIMLVTSRQPEISEWIAARVRTNTSSESQQLVAPIPDTTLSKLVEGPRRLWILGGSTLCIFFGLIHTVRGRDADGPTVSAE